MNGLLHSSVVLSLGLSLLHFLWQGTFIALILKLVHISISRCSANLKYAVNCTALAIMGLCPLITLFFIASGSPANIGSIHHEPVRAINQTLPIGITHVVDKKVSGHSNTMSRVFNLSLEESYAKTIPWFVIFWFLGIIFLSIRLLAGLKQLRFLKRSTSFIDSHRFQSILDRMGIKTAVKIAESALVSVPIVIGYLRPIIILPASALTGLDPQQLNALVAHEIAHIRRHDYIVNLIQNIIETILFYHPAVWWVSRQIRNERENCCDDLVVAILNDRVIYARALASIADSQTASAQFGLSANGGQLSSRVERILKPKSLGYTRSNWLTGVLIISIVLSCVCAFGIKNYTYAKNKMENTMPSKEYPVQALLENVPIIGYSKYTSPFPGSIAACLQYLDDPRSYDYIMGVTGAAFRRTWNRDDGGNVDIMFFAPETYDRLFKAIGYDYKVINSKDRTGMIDAVKESVSEGKPVIAFGIVGPPEAGIVAGYDKNGEELYGYSFFQSPETKGYYKQSDWYNKMKRNSSKVGMIAIGKKKSSKPSERETLTSTLEWAIDLETKQTRPNVQDHVCGLAAYDAWADSMEIDADYPKDNPKVLQIRQMVHCDQSTMLMERNFAANYLRSMVKVAPEASNELNAAAKLYDETAAQLPKIWMWGFTMSPEVGKALADSSTRKEIAKHIRIAKEKETEAVKHLEKALAILKS